ncbi:MAG: phosphoenolpyruvate carboxykinase (ATP) [Gemmataceae bacterium]|nr:phosphoenolpyruvate carboxykinase (ATP) [Gemmataceae bacterium]MDW8265683.1 phosphoenolpyruvate carboxykinase (ATP) [Gemmataceae bacterium]
MASTPEELGIPSPRAVYANLAPACLVEHALLRGEGMLTDRGALLVSTGSRTGRSPQDRYIVAQPPSEQEVDWGSVNRPITPAQFERLLAKVRDYLRGRDVFVVDGWACADPAQRLPIRVIAEKAWHALFARCLFIRAEVPPPAEAPLTVLAAPGALAEPGVDGTRSEVFVLLNLERRLIVIGGTHYAGEIKKSVFSVLNYLLPRQGVLPMHCSANIGPAGDTALFFGLSGTGKTTLSTDPYRRLIGDDEHGWSDTGIFNIEGGCYAKTIRLSPTGEPQIWNAIRFGAVVENAVIDPATRRVDFDSDRVTENTRAAYPLEHIDHLEPSGRGGHPTNIVFLTCDAFGVLPPLSRLTPEQTQYHFLSGYTAKVAGTETGVREPQATFSACFGAPFWPLPPTRYADMLRERLQRHGAAVWLVNTGWTGGAYGQGRRMPLAQTRALLRAALEGSLADVPYETDPNFGLAVPTTCPGVPPQLLRPRQTWSDHAAYDLQARRLAALFRDNFRQYVPFVPESVRRAGPAD